MAVFSIGSNFHVCAQIKAKTPLEAVAKYCSDKDAEKIIEKLGAFYSGVIVSVRASDGEEIAFYVDRKQDDDEDSGLRRRVDYGRL